MYIRWYWSEDKLSWNYFIQNSLSMLLITMKFTEMNIENKMKKDKVPWVTMYKNNKIMIIIINIVSPIVSLFEH